MGGRVSGEKRCNKKPALESAVGVVLLIFLGSVPKCIRGTPASTGGGHLKESERRLETLIYFLLMTTFII